MENKALGEEIKSRVVSLCGIRLEYTLYRSFRRVGRRYSFSVALHQTDADGIGEAYAADVSRDRRRAEEIFAVLTRGKVTVCTFFEILDEIL